MTTPIKPPTDNFPRVARGGGWYNLDAAGFRAAIRNRLAPAYRYVNLGFRCAQRGARMPVLKGLTPP